MVKTDPIYFFPFNKIKNIIQLGDIAAVDGKSQPHPLANRHAVPYAGHSLFTGPGFTPEAVVYLRQPIKGYAHIGYTDVLYPLGGFPVYQGAVGGKSGAEALCPGVFRQLKKSGRIRGSPPEKSRAGTR